MKKLTPRQKQRVLAELKKREARKANLSLEKHLFPEQLAFVQDPSKTIAALCSRRAGKTHAIVFKMLLTAQEHDYCQIPYITLTRGQAKNNIWGLLRQTDKELKLGGKFNTNELSVTFPNGSRIFLCGSNDEQEIQRLRGAKYPLVVIDEAQHFRPYITQLIRDIVEPAVLDYDGVILVTGTPGPLCRGFFYDITTDPSKGWSVHRWTARNNPYLPNIEVWLTQRRAKYGWTLNDPTYLREYCGQWVEDTNILMYKFNPKINVISEYTPGEDTYYVLGIDVGYVDSTAFVVLAYDEAAGETAVLESYKMTHMIPSAVAAHVEKLRMMYPINEIVADSNGIGKGYVEEMNQKHGLNVKAAEKQKKLAFIEHLNGAMSMGKLKIVAHKNRDLIDELTLLQWNEDRSGERDGCENHLCDALLYGWRACKQYYHDLEYDEPDIRPYSQEYWVVEEKRLEDSLTQEWEEESDKAWWELL